MKRLFIATTLAGLFLVSVGIGTGQAVAPSAVVLPNKATLLADGSVRITMKVRCNDQQQAFEWSVEIRQGTIFGNDFAGPLAGLVPCDGHFHTINALVPGERPLRGRSRQRAGSRPTRHLWRGRC